MPRLSFIALVVLSLASQRTFAQRSSFATKIAVQYSYYKINDCQCEFEPKGGFKYYDSYSPSLAFHFKLYRHLVMRSDIGFFKHQYQSNGVDATGYHSFGKVEYNETVHHTNNEFIDLKIGVALGNNRIWFVPEIGLEYYLRRNVGSDYTRSTFTNLDSFSFYKYPTVEPTSIARASSDGGSKWSTASVSLGFSSYVKIISRWNLILAARKLISDHWIKDYQFHLKFYQFTTGVSFDLSKKNEKKLETSN